MSSTAASVALVALVSALLVGTGLRKQPGLGILATLLVMGLVLWARGDGLATLGLGSLVPGWRTVALALALGVVLQVLAVLVLEPLVERLTGVAHDHAVVEGVRGNGRAFVLWMLVVWLIVAPLEEIVFRGFLMTEIARVLGTTPWAVVANVVFSAVVFGLAHGYQGRSGVWTTGLVALPLGWIFVASGYDLWLVILTHGFIDTVGIALVAVSGDRVLRRRLGRVRGPRGTDEEPDPSQT